MSRQQRILITGGAGSIGSEVARTLIRSGASVRLMDISEEGLWAFASEHRNANVDIMLGDVQFKEDCYAAVQGCAAVVHCAALKHVDLCEHSPAAADRVNFQGSVNVMRAAGDRRVVLLSTDKALMPTCVMGHTKRCAEIAAEQHKGTVNIVRFGNVIGTHGSLVPAVIRYGQMGLPIPITDPNMTRFFMTIDDAVSLILEAIQADGAGLLFAPIAPRSARIGEFVRVCRDMLAPGCQIKIVGPRPGERTHEFIEGPAPGGAIRSDDESALMDDADIRALLIRAGYPRTAAALGAAV